jgi:hypothetical protein
MHGVIVADRFTLPWEHADVWSIEECKAWLQKHRERGWRPECLIAHGSGANTLFGSILVHDPGGPAWDVSWSLSDEAYKKELIDRKSKGYRPVTAVGHTDDDGRQRFSVIWIRYRTVG